MVKINDSFIKKYFWQLFYGLLLVFAVGYILLARNKGIWADEAYTLVMIKHSYKEIWRITAADVHPPLYYFILKLLTAPLGYNIFAAKIVSVIPCVCIIALGGIQLRKLFNEKTALLFMAFVFMFPFILKYSIEIRMYSLAAFFVFANGVYALRCVKYNTKRDWLMFLIFGAAAAYTHYFALISVGIIYVLLLIAAIARRKEMLLRWAVVSAATVAIYLPWLLSFIGLLISKPEGDYWIAPITLSTIIQYFKTVFEVRGLETYSMFFMLAYFAIFIYMMFAKNKSYRILVICMLAVPLGTVAIGVGVSLVFRPVFVIRYVMPSVPFMIAMMAIALGEMENKSLFSSVLTVVLIGGISNYKCVYTDERPTEESNAMEQLVLAHGSCDCYVAVMHQYELAYYEPIKPIYVVYLTDADPADNHRSMSDFESENYDELVMIVEKGEEPGDDYKSVYKCEYDGEIGNDADVYILTKKQAGER